MSNHNSSSRAREETQFLPAAIEIAETPPSPLGRAILLTIILFFVIAIIWASLGEINIVAVARGQVIPNGRSKIVQSLISGAIEDIRVKEGQRVKAGDVLIQLNGAESSAERSRLLHEQQSHLAAMTRIETLFEYLDSPASAVNPARSKLKFNPATMAKTRQLESNLFHAQWQQHSSSIKRYQAETQRKQAEQQVIDENIKKQRKILPLVLERVQAVKQLSGKQFIAKSDYLALEQERIERQQDLLALKHQRRETDAAIIQANEALSNAIAQFRTSIIQEQSERTDRLNALTQALARNQQTQQHQSIRAPVTGVVQQLAVNTIGGAITAAQKLLIIVPESESIEVEAFLENKDIGFVNEGQSAEIKVDAYPFTKFGTLNGQVRTISKDAVAQKDLGWSFVTHVSLDQTAFKLDDKTLPVLPGMSVQVEIKTGRRKLIDFLLSPLLKGLHDSARER